MATRAAKAIEEEFIPMLVYNNRSGGMDRELLKRYREPAWNFQVVRSLDAEGKEIIPRRDRVRTTRGVARRTTQALAAAKRPVPAYLEDIAASQ